MKKVLLTTTALVMTAGVAAAEVSFSGKGQVGVSSTNDADAVLSTHIDFNVALSAASDNGVTMSTSFGYDAGQEIDYNDDYALDGQEGDYSAAAATAAGTNAGTNNNNWSGGNPEITIGYEGFTVVAQNDGVADLRNGDRDNADISVAGSMGGVTFAYAGNIEGGDDSANDDARSWSVGYAADGMSVSYASSNDHDAAGNSSSLASLSYTTGDITLSASVEDADDFAENKGTVGISYKMDSLTIAYSAATTGEDDSDLGDLWDASISYSAGALSAGIATDEDGRNSLHGTYDLGGGVSAFASMRDAGDSTSNDFASAGINFKF